MAESSARLTSPLDAQPPTSEVRQAPALAERMIALVEVLICSDYPTQLALGAVFGLAGYAPLAADGTLSLRYVLALSLVDTAALIVLILVFLKAHGERPLDVLLGSRPVWLEIAVGLRLAVVSLVGAVGVLVTIQALAPSLHTVAHNPLQDLARTPGDAALFGLVVVVAGGVREEIQRAFLLHRFEHWLGGGTAGVVVVSVAFGAGHLLQGVDAAITTGLLGAFWGVVYLRRRSAVAPVVSHAGFNLLELGQFLLGR